MLPNPRTQGVTAVADAVAVMVGVMVAILLTGSSIGCCCPTYDDTSSAEHSGSYDWGIDGLGVCRVTVSAP